jgi:predicted GIY-YIG superfamily endonuclease
MVYLLHFSRPFKHARHYTGSTTRDVADRYAEHLAGSGANLTARAVRDGITLTLARTWEGGRDVEARFKYREDPDGRTGVKQGMARYCPLCRAEKGA